MDSQRATILVGGAVVLLAMLGGAYLVLTRTGNNGGNTSGNNETTINSFQECADAGNPIMESYPRQCSADGKTFTEENCQSNGNVLTLEVAKQIAADSECGDKFKETNTCNEITGTYWLDLDIEKEGCSPACVINLETREAEINWRCTGLIEP